MANGQMILGLQMASKVFTLFVVWNLVKTLYAPKKKRKVETLRRELMA